MQGRKLNGEGSIVFEKSRNKFKAFFTDLYGERKSKRFNTKSEAMNWLLEKRSEIMNNSYVAEKNITVMEWVLQFLEIYKKNNIRTKTLERYLQTAKHLKPIGTIQLQKINAQTIQKFYNDIPNTLSASSKQKIHKLLSAAITKAYNLNIITKNIMLAVEPPKVLKQEIEIFTKAELSAIKKTLKKSQYYGRYYPIYLMAITTGARLGEILGLRWNCVHAGFIEIKNSLQMLSSGQKYDERPKTLAGYRKITITKELQNELTKIGTAEKILSLDQYVFHTFQGNAISPSNFEKAWKKILIEAGIPHKRFHALRHTHATHLLAAGVPVMEVAKRLGHSQGSHTLNLYGHAIPDYDKSLPSKISKIFSVSSL